MTSRLTRWSALVASGLLGCAALSALGPPAQGSERQTVDRTATAPRIKVRTVVSRLENAWDAHAIGGGRILVTERDRARLSVVHKGKRRTVRFPRDRVWVSGETGLMSMAVDPDFRATRRFWTCQGWQSGGGHDIRISSWTLSANTRRARLDKHLLTGLPTTSGRHGGCRLMLDARSDALLVGTGDAADENNPHDLTSLGGKVLRLDRHSGAPWPTNPFIGADDPRQRYVLTYGHRNVQGLAQHPSGAVVSVEHGPDRDDEVNLLRAGGDYGWNPGPGYDSGPMTDQSLPGQQIEAIWSSGYPTVATSGAAFTRGSAWGPYAGSLAVAALKGSRLMFMRFDDSFGSVSVSTPAAMRRHGRLRSVTALNNGDLLVTTSNGSNDKVLRVSPR